MYYVLVSLLKPKVHAYFVTRLSILLNWLHERDPVRYDVYFTQIKVAGKAGLIDHIAVPLEQVQQFYVLFNF